MKNFILTILIFLIFSTTQCFAYNLKDFSNDAKILSAMQLLEQSGDTDVFENLKRNAVKVKFYNLSTMSAGQNVFAANRSVSSFLSKYPYSYSLRKPNVVLNI